MATNLTTDTVHQGSHTFNLGLTFVIPGWTAEVYHDSGIPDTWEVRIVNPEGIMTIKTTGISFPDPAVARIFFPITAGDLDKAGTYTYQVTKTTTGARVKSEVGTFKVEESVPSLVF
jgi:hypothetical protein